MTRTMNRGIEALRALDEAYQRVVELDNQTSRLGDHPWGHFAPSSAPDPPSLPQPPPLSALHLAP